MSSVRSGSTLLRVLLNTHSQIHAPHELHLRTLQVGITADYGKLAMKQLGLDEARLEFLLWDRILHRELAASGKRIIVDKTPNNVFMWERLPQAWPKARFIFLLRHPAAIADSLYRATKEPVQERIVARVGEYGAALEQARTALPGLTVRYEDLAQEPEQVTQQICAFLDVPWERSMLDYGRADHGPFRNRLGDWSAKIKSGRIHSDVALPAAAEIPAPLTDLARAWGYLDDLHP